MRKILIAICSLMLMTALTAQVWADDGRFRIAVSDLIITDAVSKANKETILNSNLMADIENALTNSRKFEVVTRRAEVMENITNEQIFANSDWAAGDAATKGWLKNAQALVIIEVTSFSFGRSASAIPNIENKLNVSDNCSIKLSAKIIDTTSGTILASFPVNASTGSGTFMVSGSKGGASRSIMEKNMTKAAASLVNKISDTVFPIKIVNVQDADNIWINRGEDSGLKVGESFNIFAPGEELIDPDTGESLGTTESQVGQAKVVKINPKASVVKLVKGDVAQLDKGFILRRP